jgi:hypothetical protein
MKASTDETEYAEAVLDTPLSSPHNPESREEAMTIPGCHLKSKEIDKASLSRWPRYFGVLTSYDVTNDKVVVVSKTPHVDGKRTVWTGTIAEYTAMWLCD